MQVVVLKLRWRLSLLTQAQLIFRNYCEQTFVGARPKHTARNLPFAFEIVIRSLLSYVRLEVPEDELSKLTG
jgi:hypothetical protein